MHPETDGPTKEKPRKKAALSVLAGSHRNIRLRVAVGFVNRFLNSMLTPLMSIQLSRYLGAGVTGALLALVVVVTVGCTFWGGHLADARGRRFTLLLAEACVAVGYLGMALANAGWHSPIATYGFFLLLTAMGGTAFPASDSVLMDVATPEIRTSIYTINYWAMNLALAGGAAIGGLFYGGHFDELLWLGVALSIGVWIATLTGIVETRRAAPGSDRGFRSSVRGYGEAVRDRVFLRLLLAAVCIMTVELQLTYFLGVRLADGFPRQALLHLGSWGPTVNGVEMLNILRITNTILVITLVFPAKRLLTKLSETLGMNLGIVLFVLGIMGIAVSDDGRVLLLLSVVYSFGELMNVPMRQVIMVDVIDPAKRARYMALFSLRMRGAAVLASGTLALGPLLGDVGMMALYAALGLAALALLRKPSQLHRQRQQEYADAQAQVEAAQAPAPALEPEKQEPETHDAVAGAKGPATVRGGAAEGAS